MLKAQIRATRSKRLQNKEKNIIVLQRPIHRRGMFCTGTNHQQTPTSECLADYGEEESESERSPWRKLVLRNSIYSSYMNGTTRLEPGRLRNYHELHKSKMMKLETICRVSICKRQTAGLRESLRATRLSGL